MPWSFRGARQTNVEFLPVGPAVDEDDQRGGHSRYATQKKNRRKAANYATSADWNIEEPSCNEERPISLPLPLVTNEEEASNSSPSLLFPSQHRRVDVVDYPSQATSTSQQNKSEELGGSEALPTNLSSSHQELAPGFLPDASLNPLLDEDEHVVQQDCSGMNGDEDESDSNSSRKKYVMSGEESVCTRIARNGRNSILLNRFREIRKLTHELATISTNEEAGFLCRNFEKVVSFFRRNQSLRSCCSSLCDPRFIMTTPANLICSMVIVVNAVYIGIELSLNQDTGFKLGWFLCETIFMTFFILELVLRLRALGLKYSLRDSWMIFDTTLIIPSIFDVWVLQFYLANSESGMPKLTVLRLIRLARVARVLRIIRLIRYFRELILLTWGILGAVQALSWSVALLIMILYVFAVLTTNWFNFMDRAEDDILSTETGQRFDQWFGSLGSSLLTLFQIVTLEGWDEILRTCMDVSSYSVLLFIPYLILTRYMLLNAITAVVVEKVFSIAQHETSIEAKRSEKQRLKALQKLKGLFISIDMDHNASLDLREFQAALQDSHVAQQFMDLGITNYEADDLFECLDLDGNQELTVTEFIDGCLRAVGVAQNKHLLQVQYDLHRNSVVLEAKFAKLQAGVLLVLKHLSRINKLSTRSMANLAPSKRKQAGRKLRGDAIEHQHRGAHRSRPGSACRERTGGLPLRELSLKMQTIPSDRTAAMQNTPSGGHLAEQDPSCQLSEETATPHLEANDKDRMVEAQDELAVGNPEAEQQRTRPRERPVSESSRERPVSASSRKGRLSALLHPLAHGEPSSPRVSYQSQHGNSESGYQSWRTHENSVPSSPLFGHPLDNWGSSSPRGHGFESEIKGERESEQSSASNPSRWQEEDFGHGRVKSFDSIQSCFTNISSRDSGSKCPTSPTSPTSPRRSSRALTESITLRGKVIDEDSPSKSKAQGSSMRSAGKLLEAASKEQKEISNVMEGLLGELRSFHGSFAESSNLKQHRSKRST